MRKCILSSISACQMYAGLLHRMQRSNILSSRKESEELWWVLVAKLRSHQNSRIFSIPRAISYVRLHSYILFIILGTNCNPVCTLEYYPVCGTDGKTYNNACALNYQSCMSSGKIQKAYDGHCSEYFFHHGSAVVISCIIHENFSN